MYIPGFCGSNEHNSAGCSLPKVCIAETACPPRYLYQMLPQNPGIYNQAIQVMIHILLRGS